MGDLTRLTRNFSHAEVACKCGRCRGAAKISPELMAWLQAMRDEVGPNSGRRFRLLAAAIAAGFTRIGLGKTFLHLDNDRKKAQNVAWDYYPK